jgi:hypothetical protein
MSYVQPASAKAPSKPRADELIQQYEQELSKRRNFESYWQTLHDYYYLESQDVNRTYSAGNELDPSMLWDSTTVECADVFASGFMNYLTPPTSKWFRLRHRDPQLAQNKAIGAFFDDVASEVMYTLERSNFYDQMFPAYKSSGVYGTSLLFCEEDIEDDVRFYNMPLKQVVIVEDARGRVCKFYIEFEYTANQAASRWGESALSTALKEEIKEGKGESKKHKFLLFIGERYAREIQKSDKKNLPIEASWIDVEGRMIVEESGYNEFPAFCHRFDKRPFMPWGFSPAMKALPFARLLNAIAKTNLRAMMKATDPPIAVPNNAFIAPFNMNPRAINHYKKDIMQDGRDIFAFGNFGDPSVGIQAVEYYSGKVKTLMYHDTFLAFSNITKDMNNPEIMERINEKMSMLGPAVGRETDERLSPVVQRVIGVLYRAGKLPEPPPELMMNPSYNIDFVGVLAQSQRRAELNTLITGLSMVGNMAQYSPEVLDKIDPDKVTDEVWAITGAPIKVLRDDDEIQKIREGRAQAAVQQQEMGQVATGAEIAKSAGAAEASFAKAKGGNQ